MKFKVRIPLQYVKPVCIAAVLVGIFAVAAGSWVTRVSAAGRLPAGEKLLPLPPLRQKAGYEVPAVQGQLLPGLQGRAAPGSRKKRREIIGLFSARRLRYNKA